MKESDARRAVEICAALAELPSVRKRLKAKPAKHHDKICLELSAADMVDGQGQGSEAYFYMPADLAEKVIAGAETLLLAEAERLKVTPATPRRNRK